MKYNTEILLNDITLRPLRLMLDPAQSSTLIQHGLPYVYQNNLRVITSQPEIMKYKPGKRAVLKYRWKIGKEHNSTKEIIVIAKIYNSDRGSHIERRLRHIKDYCHQNNISCFFPDVMGYLPQSRTLLQEYIDGKSIRYYLNQDSAGDYIKNIARILAQLHGIHLELPPKRIFQTELEQLQTIVESVKEIDPDLYPRIKNQFIQLEKNKGHENPITFRLIHRDFHHEQVLFNEKGAVLIDLDDVCMGEPELDLGNFMAHLRLLALEMKNEIHHYDLYREIFLGEYRIQGKAKISDKKVQLYESATNLRLACILLKKKKHMDWLDNLLKINETIF